MTFDSLDSLPQRVQIQEIVSSRYDGCRRPQSWDLRAEGEEIIRTVDGRTLRVYSDGGQSTPQPGWVILLTSGDATIGYRWTLYGMPATGADSQLNSVH